MDYEKKQLRREEKRLNKLILGFTNITGEFISTTNVVVSSYSEDWSVEDLESSRKEHEDMMDRLDRHVNRVTFSEIVIEFPPEKKEWYLDYINSRKSDITDRIRFDQKVKHLERLLFNIDIT